MYTLKWKKGMTDDFTYEREKCYQELRGDVCHHKTQKSTSCLNTIVNFTIFSSDTLVSLLLQKPSMKSRLQKPSLLIQIYKYELQMEISLPEIVVQQLIDQFITLPLSPLIKSVNHHHLPFSGTGT